MVKLRLQLNLGVVSARDLAALGCDANDIRGLLKRRVIHRVRRCAYVDANAYAMADLTSRHVLAVRAVLGTLHNHAACGPSAAAFWDLPVPAGGLELAHVAQIGAGRARSAGGGLRVHAPVPALVVVRHTRAVVVERATAAVQLAGISVRDGLMAADAALQRSMCTVGALRRVADEDGSRSAARVAELTSELSESPGESSCRLVFAALGLPQPEQQVRIFDEQGWLIARVDFLFRARKVVVAFDGDVKYGGADGRDALIKEKRREDALRARGYRVVRLTWADLRHPDRVLALLQLALAT